MSDPIFGCSRCYRSADRLAYGKYRNGRPVEEPVCRAHAPTWEENHTERFCGTRRYIVLGVKVL